ncbi:MAG: acyl carrier protein [Legionellales bacterium]|jgi:acyl carrier protein
MSAMFNEVVDIINKISGVDKSAVTLDSNLISDLKIDSLDFLDITYEIDKKYNINIPVEEWVEEANSQTEDAKLMFTLRHFLDRVQKLIDEKK